jgi:hypothetical protein
MHNLTFYFIQSYILEIPNVSEEPPVPLLEPFNVKMWNLPLDINGNSAQNLPANKKFPVLVCK